MNENLLVDARIRTLSRLSSATMHELRGAANSVALHLQLLTIEPEDDDAFARRRRSLAAVDDGRRRMFDIAEVFVRHAVLPDARPIEFDVGRVAADAVALAHPYAVQRRVEMRLAPTAATTKVLGRRDVVSQVLLDLMLSMLDRTDGGGTIDVAVQPGAQDVRVAITSSVPGTTPDAETVDRVESAMRWAGGDLRCDAGNFVVRLPVPPPGESA
jgi:hypothetical protein